MLKRIPIRPIQGFNNVYFLFCEAVVDAMNVFLFPPLDLFYQMED